jgi:hypothetical protein
MMLHRLIGMLKPQLGQAARRMWTAEPALERYRDWLAVCYDLVRATEPLLAEAVAESQRRGELHLAAYFDEQLVEESGHDRWLEADWVAAGGELTELVQRIPEPAAARIAGAQYYWIRHAHPVALTGHIAVLEWHPPSPALVPDLMRRTGLPRQAFQTLALHAELDAEHGGRLERLLTELPLTAAQQRLTTTSAVTTAHGLVELMTDLGDRRDAAFTPGAPRLQPAVPH